MVCSKTITQFAFRRYKNLKRTLPLQWIMDFYDFTVDFSFSSLLLSNQMLSRIKKQITLGNFEAALIHDANCFD